MGKTISDVLRIRRHQPTRLEGFVDASFAFAVTLLVISVGHVPGSVPEMLQALRGVPTFALCFLLISRLWAGHRAWSRHYDIEDATTIWLSLILVFLVLIYVYPLRLLLSLMFAGFSGGWLVDQPVDLHSVTELRAAYAVFGIGYAAIGAVFALLYRHALHKRVGIGLDAAEVLVTKVNIVRWSCVGAVALCSALLAYVLPLDPQQPWQYAAPGCIYWLMFLIFAQLRRSAARRLAQLPAASTP